MNTIKKKEYRVTLLTLAIIGFAFLTSVFAYSIIKTTDSKAANLWSFAIAMWGVILITNIVRYLKQINK